MKHTVCFLCDYSETLTPRWAERVCLCCRRQSGPSVGQGARSGHDKEGITHSSLGPRFQTFRHLSITVPNSEIHSVCSFLITRKIQKKLATLPSPFYFFPAFPLSLLSFLTDPPVSKEAALLWGNNVVRDFRITM